MRLGTARRPFRCGSERHGGRPRQRRDGTEAVPYSLLGGPAHFFSIFSGGVHLYTVGARRASTLIGKPLSGVTPSMSKSCDTMRQPSFSFFSCGISLTFSDGSRYSVTIVAPLR